MKLKVLSYEHDHNFHICTDENLDKHRVDMFVNGDFPVGMEHELIVGNTYEVERLTPYLSLAYGVNPNPINHPKPNSFNTEQK